MGITCESLGLSQSTLRAKHACATVSAYLATGYFLHSTQVMSESLRRWIVLACSDWLARNPIPAEEPENAEADDPDDYETAEMALKHKPELCAVAELDADLESSGLMLQDNSLLDLLPEYVRKSVLGEEAHMLLGLEPALQKVADAILQDGSVPLDAPLQFQPVRGFVFSRGGFSISGAVRRLPGQGGLRFDLVDSHHIHLRRLMIESAEDNAYSGVWASCDSVKGLCSIIEILYPSSSTADAKLLNRHAADIRMDCQYSLMVFKRKKHPSPPAAMPYVSALY